MTRQAVDTHAASCRLAVAAMQIQPYGLAVSQLI